MLISLYTQRNKKKKNKSAKVVQEKEREEEEEREREPLLGSTEIINKDKTETHFLNIKIYLRCSFFSKGNLKNIVMAYGLVYHHVEYYQVMIFFIHECVHLLYDS